MSFYLLREVDKKAKTGSIHGAGPWLLISILKKYFNSFRNEQALLL
jgi:hypothetical protein